MSDTPRSPSLRSPDRSPSLRQRVGERVHDVADDFEAWLDAPVARSPGNCVGECAGGLEELDCEGLEREKKAVDEARDKAQLSEAMYEPRDQRRLPPGYRHATDAELQQLGLINADTGSNLLRNPDIPDFQADVFRYRDGRYVVGFRGTSKISEGIPSIGHGLGLETQYYSQATEIAREITLNAPGGVSFTGHSLGGGLASAAAFETGAPATTFNTSGLHAKNVAATTANPRVRDWYVRGEILNAAQDAAAWMHGKGAPIRRVLGIEGSTRPIMPGAAGRRIRLDPVRHSTEGLKIGERMDRIAKRSIRLHGIDEVRQSLNARHSAIEDLQVRKGC